MLVTKKRTNERWLTFHEFRMLSRVRFHSLHETLRRGVISQHTRHDPCTRMTRTVELTAAQWLNTRGPKESSFVRDSLPPVGRDWGGGSWRQELGAGNCGQETGDRGLGTGNWGQGTGTGTGDRELAGDRELGTGDRELGAANWAQGTGDRELGAAKLGTGNWDRKWGQGTGGSKLGTGNWGQGTWDRELGQATWDRELETGNWDRELGKSPSKEGQCCKLGPVNWHRAALTPRESLHSLLQGILLLLERMRVTVADCLRVQTFATPLLKKFRNSLCALHQPQRNSPSDYSPYNPS